MPEVFDKSLAFCITRFTPGEERYSMIHGLVFGLWFNRYPSVKCKLICNPFTHSVVTIGT